jgi:hypothetical protein
MADIRAALRAGTFLAFRASFIAAYISGGAESTATEPGRDF